MITGECPYDVRYVTHRAVVQGPARLHANCAAKRLGSKMFRTFGSVFKLALESSAMLLVDCAAH